ncbi:GNAT family N-acetyltransferase [Tessaracoccus timonensis]|uniref:GNAT family N-acetyltransferase n=1 Tax=Tessaracoccus timonensis TaxID=2161816 RepID=UPI000D54F024|nr:GNAT family N-acetyltransferase [Tessaracoccus timonensis]
MTEQDTTLRPLRPDEGPLLERATLGTMNWCGDRFTIDEIRSRPEFRHYTRLDEARGDFGVVAEADGGPVGVAWSLMLSDDDRGYGFVDESTPEVSLWVDEAARGRGLGRALLRAVVAEAEAHGLRQVSLSVEADNFAVRLYEAEGFVAVPGRETDGVMLRRIG